MPSLDPQLDDLELRKKRLLYRAQHRGTQELDILVGGFVAGNLAAFDAQMLSRLEALLSIEETELSSYLMGQEAVPAGIDAALVATIRAYREQQVQAQQ